MSKQFAAVIVALIALFIGIVAFSGHNKNSTSSKSSSSSLTKNVQGNPNAKVKLVEYGDFQCPYCQAYYPTIKQIQAEFNDQMQFQFRNFPLVNAHPNAFAAARAAQAAAGQGKFWEMHDMLYETSNWQVWTQAKDPTTYFDAYAQSLGLNVSKYKTDFASDATNTAINADMAEGTKLGVAGTPSFFINGKAVQIANTTASFEKVIKAELAKQTTN